MDAYQPIESPNQGNGEISRRIAEIVRKRQSLAERIKPVHQHIDALLKEIAGIDHHRQRLLEQIDDPEVKNNLGKISLSPLNKRIEQESRELEKLMVRLSRSTLNVGVVGRMGQGKSTFLKSLSDLTDNEIPAREGGACTAVRSKIYHHDGDTEATVTLHSESTFLKEVIGEYYRELKLGDPPINLDAFANDSLPPSPKSATHEEMYKRLRDDYKSNLQSYRPLLESSSPHPISIPQQDIPKYVTQPRDEQNRLVSFEHLAVREVQIRCRFPKTEVSQLGLVDVPGLGDTRVGDETLILNTLEQEVDLILFFRRPDMKRYLWEKQDFQLYDLAARGLNNLSQRSFLVLNHLVFGNQDNLKGCNLLKNNTGSIKVIDCVIADCSKPEDANRVLDLALSHLDEHIVDLEEQYARSCQNRLIFEIHNSINAELEQAQIALLSYVRESEQFEGKFKQLMQALSNGLVEMLDELAKQRDEIDTSFEAAVKAALQKCESDSGIPSNEAEITSRTRDPDYKNSYQIIYDVYARELRNHLSKNFLSLDEGLQEASNKLKLQIAEVMITKGGLRELAKALGVEGIEFLEALRGILATRQNKLELAFNTLVNFKMSYGALLLWQIRRDLDQVIGGVSASSQPEGSVGESIKAGAEIIGEVALAAANPQLEIPEVKAVQAGLEVIGNVTNAVASNLELVNAATVHKNLQNLHKRSVDKCRETLKKRLNSPSQNRYYIAEEFVDRVLYERDIKTAWRHFLSDPEIRSKVWVEFKQLEERKQIEQDWLNAVKKVSQINQRERLEFLP